MSKADMLQESRYMDLSDEDLKELLGYLWEQLKSLTEAQKNDEEILELLAQVKALKTAKYGDQLKLNKKRLKAARMIASTRNINWKVFNE